MDKRKVSFIYRLLVIASLATGISLNLYNTPSVLSLVSYYTMQTNIMCLVAFIFFEIADIANKKYKNHETYYLIKGALVISVLIMVVVYTISLSPEFSMTPNSMRRRTEYKMIGNVLVHEISPILVILDYFLFDEKGNLKAFYPLIWMFIPANYVLYVYTYSSMGGQFYNTGGSRRVAYFFLDHNLVGYKGVVFWLALIGFVIISLSFFLVLIDKKLAKLKKRNNKEGE